MYSTHIHCLKLARLSANKRLSGKVGDLHSLWSYCCIIRPEVVTSGPKVLIDEVSGWNLDHLKTRVHTTECQQVKFWEKLSDQLSNWFRIWGRSCLVGFLGRKRWHRVSKLQSATTWKCFMLQFSHTCTEYLFLLSSLENFITCRKLLFKVFLIHFSSRQEVCKADFKQQTCQQEVQIPRGREPVLDIFNTHTILRLVHRGDKTQALTTTRNKLYDSKLEWQKDNL